MKNTNTSSSFYRPDIDGLRAIAVLSVVFYHAFPNGILTGGFIGVDIFFVISGFLISLILLGDLHKQQFSIKAFYSRRILRIFPALITVLLVCLIIGWFSLFPDEYKQIGKHTIGGATFISNLMLWKEVGYFDNVATLKPLLHLWSLGVEEQFYIVWPALLFLLWKNKSSFFKSILILCIASFSYSIYCANTNPTGAFYSPLTRLWELLLGGMLAYLTVYNKKMDRASNLQSLVGLVLIIVGMFTINISSKFPGYLVLLPVLGAFLIISAGSHGWINKKILSNKLLVSIGLISYPLYLWHWPILSFLRISNADGTFRDVSIFARSAAIIIALLLSWATYKLIEKPIRFGNKKKLWTGALCMAMIISLSFGAMIFSTNGFPNRIQLIPSTSSVLFADYPHPFKNEACTKMYPELANGFSCLLSKSKPANVAIMGDSHAHQYYQSIAKKLPNASVLNYSYPPCLPFSSNYEGPICSQVVPNTIKFIEKAKSIDTYILTAYFSILGGDFKDGNIEGKRVANELTEANKKILLKSADKILSTLTALNKKIIIFIDIPDVVFKPRECVTYPNPIIGFLRGGMSKKTADNCGILWNEFQKRNSSHDKALAEILAKYPNVIVFNPRSIFCDGVKCTIYKNGNFLYWNSDHLTVAGADLVIDSFIKEKKQQLHAYLEDPSSITINKKAHLA